MLYKVILKPTGSFYFGGENSFGEARSKGNNDNDIANNYFAKRSAYFAKGEMFPQQTQVLGMLRKEIMRKEGCLKLHNSGECIKKGKKKDAVELVGLNWKDGLGKIVKLSPLFLEKDDEIFIPSPFDKDLSMCKEKGRSYINGRKSEAVYAFEKDDVKDNAENKMFGAKDHLSEAYISDKSTLNLHDIFTAVTRIGNQSLNYTDDDEEQLYKVTSYRLDNTFKFVCYLQLEEDIFSCDTSSAYKSIVELGGERSTFKITVTKTNKVTDYQSIYDAYNKSETRIVLLSDSYITNDIFASVDVVLSQKNVFRTITSNKDTFSKSSKLILLKKGTVFYAKDNNAKAICDLIEKEESFRKIGYNQYIKIDKKEG